MLEGAGIINRVKEHLGPEDFPDERVSRIMAMLFARAEEGKNTDASCIMESLADDDVAHIVCESALEGDTLAADHKDKAVDDCIQRLKGQTLKMRRESLHEKIKQAHTAGDDAAVRRFMEEFQILTKAKK
jgi:replicative DNA helicase